MTISSNKLIIEMSLMMGQTSTLNQNISRNKNSTISTR